MSVIIIGNVDSEYMNSAPELLDWATLCTDSAVANRLAWYLEPDSLLIAPSPPSAAFLEYGATVTGAISDVTTVSPVGSEYDQPRLLTGSVLLSDAIVEATRTWLHELPFGTRCEVIPYYYDRNVATFCDRLGLQVRYDNAFLRGGGAEYFNSKSGFSRTAGYLGLPFPHGEHADTRDTLASAIEHQISATGRAIVKMDHAAGGDGNTLVYRPGRECPGIGTTRRIEAAEDWGAVAHRIWQERTGERGGSFVVEPYYAHAESFYSEYLISAGGTAPGLRNFGRMRMEPVWNGFEIPAVTMTPCEAAQFASASAALAGYAHSMGYVGLLNIDGIVTADGDVLINEFNGRYGGCSHIDHLSRILYGHNYLTKIHIVTRNHVPSRLPFTELIAELTARNLAWTADSGEGVIVLTEDCGRTGTFEYIVYAKSPEMAAATEARVIDAAK